MDIVAHGLWGGVGFCRYGQKRYFAAFFFGVAPDLFSFGLFHLANPGWITLRLLGEISGPPPLSILPSYVFYAYSLTHSFVVWGAIFIAAWLIHKKPPWLLLAWWLHIFCDIPTHGAGYFPTPYLWPFPTPLVDGVSWTTPWLLVANYVSLGAAYAAVAYYLRRVRRGGQ